MERTASENRAQSLSFKYGVALGFLGDIISASYVPDAIMGDFMNTIIKLAPFICYVVGMSSLKFFFQGKPGETIDTNFPQATKGLLSQLALWEGLSAVLPPEAMIVKEGIIIGALGLGRRLMSRHPRRR